MRVLVEICVERSRDAIHAFEGGADRVELCADLAVDGLTPSWDALEAIDPTFRSRSHVLIRPRAGDFRYRPEEFDIMRREVAEAKARGAGGVVLGVLQADGTIDQARTAQLVAEARPLRVTFHKAFDITRDPFEALETLIELGVERVLTSGGARTACEGIAVLSALHQQGAGRIIVMAGGRITLPEIPVLIRAGLREIHLGSAASVEGVVSVARVREIVARTRPGFRDRSATGGEP